MFEISVFDLLDFESVGEGEDEYGQCYFRGLFDYIYNDIFQVVYFQLLIY